ncbi:hypothetical protein [Enhygromyxa salina]|uniref:Uncharacterized protein n=1 Tax=Enhygromyxa salina TaxID=215803 RepID=A0A2S9YNB4_9BACT|nr:hypothetical protein [Enhygromyxa salina]PRQ06576.1 hypothetical protein ENSA7_37290 [Enhygromyxa salina]
MNLDIRHVIDESGLRLDGAPADDAAAVADVIDEFLDRLETAKQRDERVLRSLNDIWDAPVTEEVKFYELVYDSDPAVPLDLDRRRRLLIAIDRVPSWDEQPELVDLVNVLEVSVDGELVFAPSLALAHACRQLSRAVGCLNFESSGRSGLLQVEAEQLARDLHFVVDERTHVELFRDAVGIESMDEAAFEANVRSAFPCLRWVDRVWRGLGKFKRPYTEHRGILVKHLSTLNDVAAQLFNELSATSPEQISAGLGAHGVNASDENGRTKSDKKASKDRTREFEGEDHVFWWHTKLLPDTDRIHFKWLRSNDDGPGTIVVGIFIDHCHLPG